MSKTNRTSLGHGSMRLVHRRNNPNKETLIYIPLSHVTVIQYMQPELQNDTTNYILASYYNWDCLSCRLQYASHSIYFHLQLVEQVI